MTDRIDRILARMPKAELHMHLEGSLEPELLFALGRRNAVALKYATEAELKAAYDFKNLQDFLDVYYAGLSVLKTRADYFDMTWAYLSRVRRDETLHAEVFVSPQAHTRRGVPEAEMIGGIFDAFDRARTELGMSALLIAGIQRQWSEDDAFEMIARLKPWHDRIAGLGMGGPELPNPPAKFERVFAHARAMGWKTCAHAGEEGPADYVAQTFDVLKVDRIDHGVRAAEDPALLARLAQAGVPFTVCPLSNVALKVFPDLESHNLKRLLDAGVMATMNSDDPSYFGGYMNENYLRTRHALGLTETHLRALAHNGFEASFLPPAEKARHLAALDAAWAAA